MDREFQNGGIASSPNEPERPFMACFVTQGFEAPEVADTVVTRYTTN